MNGTISFKAMRAIVRGLYQGGAISDKAVMSVMRELQVLIAEETPWNRHDELDALRELSSNIGKDARIAD